MLTVIIWSDGQEGTNLACVFLIVHDYVNSNSRPEPLCNTFFVIRTQANIRHILRLSQEMSTLGKIFGGIRFFG